MMARHHTFLHHLLPKQLDRFSSIKRPSSTPIRLSQTSDNILITRRLDVESRAIVRVHLHGDLIRALREVFDLPPVLLVDATD
jgi:hypothetical protein